MKLKDLKFDTANNAALSLRLLAEMARIGEITIEPTLHDEAPKWIRLEVYDMRERG